MPHSDRLLRLIERRAIAVDNAVVDRKISIDNNRTLVNDNEMTIFIVCW
jgi:hypothetical protein